MKLIFKIFFLPNISEISCLGDTRKVLMGYFTFFFFFSIKSLKPHVLFAYQAHLTLDECIRSAPLPLVGSDYSIGQCVVLGGAWQDA